MLSGIPRVISDSDNIGEQQQQQQQPETADTTPITANYPAAAPIVDLKMAANNPNSAPFMLIGARRESEAAMSSSTVSELSDAAARDASMLSIVDAGGGNTMMMVDGDEQGNDYSNPAQPPNTAASPPATSSPMRRVAAPATIQRMDSRDSSGSGSQRASSQNSSRDWGWFEDVHQSLTDGGAGGAGGGRQGAPGGKNAQQQQQGSSGLSSSHEHHRSESPKGKKRGLVPQVSGEVQELLQKPENVDAAAMAVTAPTYVLEESLSSQRLWKDTAGQRPPQPVEERAFYEKMWAQNFARSQVKYDMPVEVLTATSPISLSPFADGNFEGPATSVATSYTITSTTIKDGASADAAAEAALRLHDAADSGAGSYLKQQVVNRKVRGYGSDGDLTVLVRGDNVFGTTVSKSFALPSSKGGPIVGVDTVNISIASYRVVESNKYGKYAQFLVIYREGSIRDTIGVWKRYRDFEELARLVTQAHEGCASVIANMSPLAVTEEPETEHLPNAITSWRLLKKRQRWYRCLDAGYLSLKVFLLERFLHDILFESSSPKLLREFVAADTA